MIFAMLVLPSSNGVLRSMLDKIHCGFAVPGVFPLVLLPLPIGSVSGEAVVKYRVSFMLCCNDNTVENSSKQSRHVRGFCVFFGRGEFC